MELKNKVAVVTGGASGLGKATVELLVAGGARVAIFDLNEEAGKPFANELSDAAEYMAVDVVNEDAVRDAIAKVADTFGGLHICLNFAGIGSACKIYSAKKGVHPLDYFRRIVDVNLIGTFNAARFSAEQMAKNDPIDDDGQRGIIVNTASVAAYEGQIGQVAYSASKSGVVGMTLPMSRDLASIGVRVNTIVPGTIHTPLFDKAPDHVRDGLIQMIQFPKRLGKPEEIAQLAISMIENDYLNGECIRLDGGIRMQPR